MGVKGVVLQGNLQHYILAKEKGLEQLQGNLQLLRLQGNLQLSRFLRLLCPHRHPGTP